VARVAIGMPVLNAEGTVARALRDLQAQTYPDIEIVVCDNASTDRTAEIVEELASADPRIRLVRFREKVDILGSFRRAWEQCSAPYFMFAPADDRWYASWIAEAVAVLDADPELAACNCRVAFTDDGLFAGISSGTRPIAGSARQRLRRFWADPAENARAFGVYRHGAFAGAFPDRWIPGWDFVFTARALMHGNQAEIPRVLMERDRTPLSKYVAEFDRYFRGKPGRWFPLAPVMGAVLRDRAMPKDPGVLWNLMVLVLRSHVTYALHRTRRWGPFVARLAERVRLMRWPISAPLAEDQAPTAISSGASPSASRSARISSR